MNDIPLEIWQMIMLMSNNVSQFNMKQTCKFLYNNLRFSKNYLDRLYRKYENYFKKKSVSFFDVIKYIVEKYDLTGPEIVTDIGKSKDMEKINCILHDLYPVGNGRVKCSECNFVHSCSECYAVNYDPILHIGVPQHKIFSEICSKCGIMKKHHCYNTDENPLDGVRLFFDSKNLYAD